MERHPWEQSYPVGINWREPLRASAIGALFASAVCAHKDRTMIEFYGRSITYGEMDVFVNRLCAVLQGIGIRPGDLIALYTPNSPFHPIAFFAALKLGAVVTHLTPLDAEREIDHKLRDSGARVIVTVDNDQLLSRARAQRAAGAVDHILVGHDDYWSQSPFNHSLIDEEEGCISLCRALADESMATPTITHVVRTEDLALVQYTGGTTGRPKGAMLSHGNLTSTVSLFNTWMAGQSYWNEAGERHIGVLPLFHIYALAAILLRATARGDVILLRSRFDAAQTLVDIDQGRATWFFAVPTMLIALIDHTATARCDFSSLSLCVSGGAPLPAEVARRFEALTGCAVCVGWGMTETCGAGLMSLPGRKSPPDELGLPLPGVTIDIVALDDPQRVLPAGEVGEIRIGGPNVTAGYLGRAEESAATLVQGRLLTGDIGFMDARGFVSLVDRKKDMIISGGYNVYPRVVEDAIYEHSAVEEVLVYGITDAYRGEAAKAAIKLRDGVAAFTLEELRRFLADKVGRHELPAALEFLPALPRTAVGKLSKKELYERDRRASADEIDRAPQSPPRKE